MQLHVERWHPNNWQLLATVTAQAEQSFCVEYEPSHALQHQNAITANSLSASVPVTLEPMIFNRWPAFLRDLIPQGESRKRLAKLLNVPDRPSSDWTLLAHGGGNPIGHLRIREAANWLKETTLNIHAWTQDEITHYGGGFLDVVEAVVPNLGGGIQGEWPKLMLTESHDGFFYLDHMLTDLEAKQHWIVKLPRQHHPFFDLILKAEAAYHQVACDLGLSVGEVRYQNGALFIERFDRTRNSHGVIDRIAQESLYAACGSNGIEPVLSHHQACKSLSNIVTNRQPVILEYVWRDILNLALGNRDNHGRNTAIHRHESDGNDGCIQLAPIFDFGPMLMHPDGLVRRMRWRQEEASRPNWQLVAEHLDDEQILPKDALMNCIADWQDQLSRVPELLRRYGCPEQVMSRIDTPFKSTMKTLSESIM